jgi:hypothetical protein
MVDRNRRISLSLMGRIEIGVETDVNILEHENE